MVTSAPLEEQLWGSVSWHHPDTISNGTPDGDKKLQNMVFAMKQAGAEGRQELKASLETMLDR